MSDDPFELPALPSALDSLPEENQVRSRHDVRWSGLWKVIGLPNWKRRIRVQMLETLQGCVPAGQILTNVFLPQGVVVTLDSVGQVKEFGSTEWYFVYLCECHPVTVPPTTAPPHTTSAPVTGPGGLVPTQILTSRAPTSEAFSTGPPTTGPVLSTVPVTTVTPGEALNECHDCDPVIPDILGVTLDRLCELGLDRCCFVNEMINWNGVHQVHWGSMMGWPAFADCRWTKGVEFPEGNWQIMYVFGQAWAYYGPPYDYWAWRWIVHLTAGTNQGVPPDSGAGAVHIRWNRDNLDIDSPCDVEGPYTLQWCSSGGGTNPCRDSCVNSPNATARVDFP